MVESTTTSDWVKDPTHEQNQKLLKIEPKEFLA